MTERLPITAIVASHNEGHLLPECLDALGFCDELIVIDVDSSDDTAAVAERRGARLLHHPWVPIAEQAREQAIREARHDWVLIRDPDEIVPPALAADLRNLFPRLEPDVGIVAAPTQRYFAGRPLRGTVWGGVKVDRLLAKRGLVEFPTGVHRRLPRRPGCREVTIPFTGDNAIRHLWSGGYRSFFERHRRYLKLEGASRADGGELASRRTLARAPLHSFGESFVRERGWRDGVRGLVLSVLWALYRTGSELVLLREQRRRAGG